MASNQNLMDFVNQVVAENKVVVFSKTWCPYCTKVKQIFDKEGVAYRAVELDQHEDGNNLQYCLFEKTKQKTVPNVFINGRHVGGCSDVENALGNGTLTTLLAGTDATSMYQYHAIVIGGGSGGIACAKALAAFGKKVALCDFVPPSPLGTTWGIGGTCVNVGCIPKKLMHRAALIHEDIKDAQAFGWQIPENVNHDWSTMVTSVQSYIRSLNWNYRKSLKEKGVTYFNAYARLAGDHTVGLKNKKGEESLITGDNIIIAVGCRPRYPEAPGVKEYCITSDDIFSLSHVPGKTLVVGASYVALECACFLKGINMDVTVMVRSILLRGFDRSMAEKVGENMVKKGITFVKECVIDSVTQIKPADGKEPPELQVVGKFTDGSTFTDTFNTVLIATGRYPCTEYLECGSNGVTVSKDGKIVVDEAEKTSVPYIYAIGDVAAGRPELTPVAIQAGQLLARRLAQNADGPLMNYRFIPSTVFTTIEYGCVGDSEEEANERYPGKIVVYHDIFKPLEKVLTDSKFECYGKLVCAIQDDGKEKVVGFHVLGPHAGEVTQGFALAVKMGVSKAEFDDLVGIHPTCAEVFTTMNITTTSGQELSDSKGC